MWAGVKPGSGGVERHENLTTALMSYRPPIGHHQQCERASIQHFDHTPTGVTRTLSACGCLDKVQAMNWPRSLGRCPQFFMPPYRVCIPN
jgi:hypothetical protein